MFRGPLEEKDLSGASLRDALPIGGYLEVVSKFLLCIIDIACMFFIVVIQL